ncbi:hypothetical protein K474DRAFT_53515 [Panus rudis PR-1116 ss-1]|nr:hypothetical protein K474DRAFT_53515 [Panus rudis PR-1116 ss-1]
MLQEDSDLWFQDGTIIIVAGETKFRLHPGVLSRHSEVFKDMFNVPQPPEAQADPTMEYIDNCPAVRVSESAEDMALLLSAMYDPGCSIYLMEHPMTCSVASTLLRLSAKYEVPRVHATVSKRFPLTFPESIEKLPLEPFLLKSPLVLDGHSLFQAIRLMHEYDMKLALPAAFYYAAQLSYEKMLNGILDQSWRASDMQKCLEVREILLKADYQLYEPIFDHTFTFEGGCGNREECEASIREQMLNYGGVYGDIRSLVQFPAWLDHLRQHTGICNDCSVSLNHHCEATRYSIWADIGRVSIRGV